MLPTVLAEFLARPEWPGFTELIRSLGRAYARNDILEIRILHARANTEYEAVLLPLIRWGIAPRSLKSAEADTLGPIFEIYLAGVVAELIASGCVRRRSKQPVEAEEAGSETVLKMLQLCRGGTDRSDVPGQFGSSLLAFRRYLRRTIMNNSNDIGRKAKRGGGTLSLDGIEGSEDMVCRKAFRQDRSAREEIRLAREEAARAAQEQTAIAAQERAGTSISIIERIPPDPAPTAAPAPSND